MVTQLRATQVQFENSLSLVPEQILYAAAFADIIVRPNLDLV